MLRDGLSAVVKVWVLTHTPALKVTIEPLGAQLLFPTEEETNNKRQPGQKDNRFGWDETR
jgi:hypothetical protein